MKSLFAFESYGRDPQKNLAEALVLLKEIGTTKETSSVFRILGQGRSLCVVVFLELLKDTDKVSALLSEMKSRLDVEGNLLLLEDKVQLNPILPVPHPELHTKPHWLIPASELWSDAVHPVHKKTLSELVSHLRDEPWGEFVAQGKAC